MPARYNSRFKRQFAVKSLPKNDIFLNDEFCMPQVWRVKAVICPEIKHGWRNTVRCRLLFA
uniref:Uncharacterized protein n=1 Tax=Rheinheimera sp. BAL341 TaxID=1708203 RepID=A0A486XS23_9GAMM